MDIKKEIKKFETHKEHFKNVLIDEIILLAQSVCRKYKKVVDSFHIEDESIYLWFDYETTDEYGTIRVTTANNIDNTEDWDIIEEFGINENKSFIKLCELYKDYGDLLKDETIELERENNFNE